MLFKVLLLIIRILINTVVITSGMLVNSPSVCIHNS